MRIDELSKVSVISNSGDRDVSICFEPRCEEYILHPNEEIEILAEAQDEDLPFEVNEIDDGFQVFSASGNAYWYIRKGDTLTSTLELAFGVTKEELLKKAEVLHVSNNPWWKLW